MKTILTFILSLTYFSLVYAQNIDLCLNIKVETIEACEKAEACVDKLADFVLKSPFKERDKKGRLLTSYSKGFDATKLAEALEKLNIHP